VLPVFTSLSHDPQQCAAALRGAAPGGEVVIDLETTGLGRCHRVVSVGVLLDKALFVLFVGSIEFSVARLNVSHDSLRQALAPLAERPDLIAVFHNANFDLGFLERAGVRVTCEIHDTAKLFLLLDADRRRDAVWRVNRVHDQRTNYRLKDLAILELGLNAPHFPGAAKTLTYAVHVRYLASDCCVTQELYQYLKHQLRKEDFDYYRTYVAPVTPLLVAMTNAGIRADVDFVNHECDRLLGMMRSLADAHEHQFGVRLDAGDFGLRGHIYFSKNGLRRFVDKSKWVRVGARRLPPLDRASLNRLRRETPTGSFERESLEQICDYTLVRTTFTRLAALRDKGIDLATSRIYSTLDDWQASGRVSATKPNVQGIANEVAPGAKHELVSTVARDFTIRSRDTLRASPGAFLASFDINRADIASWAHVVSQLHQGGADYIERLEVKRLERLRSALAPYLAKRWNYYRPTNRKPVYCPRCGAELDARRASLRRRVPCRDCKRKVTIEGRIPHFDPADASPLIEDFRQTKSDFYETVTRRILGRPPSSKTERNAMKQTILGMVNGMSAQGLARTLEVDVATARSYIEQFANTYPKETAFIELMHHAIAVTGCSESFGGRRRRVSPHFWMVNEPEVELFLSYRNADKLWVRVVPLQPSRHTLCCWVLSVIDAKYGSPRRGKEIYHHVDGRISHAPYRFFDDASLVFGLPVRNISWRLIRRVRTQREECTYQGFDVTRRQLTNHIFQASTADVARRMMLRTQPVCRDFGARLALQIHDELLFEVPGSQRQLMKFVRQAARVLEQPPTANFAVPITVGPKIGTSFGSLRELERWEIASPWPVRLWRQTKRTVSSWLRGRRFRRP
jgi:DNA polymerase I-like protein with 3'-5' exonuclease and polymerase domains